MARFRRIREAVPVRTVTAAIGSLACVAVLVAAPPRVTRVAASDQQLVDWLRKLEPLPKVHYSWPVPDRYLHPLDGLLYEYARITHAISLRGETCTRQQIDTAVSICNRINKTEPDLPATIALNYSPWHRRFGKELPATETGRTHVEEIRQMRERFAFVAEYLATANRLEKADVSVSAVLFDCERFVIRPNDAAWNKAVQDKQTAAVTLARQYFPGVRVEWYDRGGVSVSASATGWTRSKRFTLREPGDSFSCSLYRVPEIQTTRETVRRTVELADAAGVEVTAWVALASGYRRKPTDMSVWSWDWRYDLTYSWQLGAEINQPWYSQPKQRDRFAPWHKVTRVVFYPEPFGRAPLWGLHFVAYVRGAHLIRQLPGDDAPGPTSRAVAEP